MKFNPLTHLLNTGFTMAEIGLFYDGEHLGAKIWRLLSCSVYILQDHFRMAIQYFLNREWQCVEKLQILVAFLNILPKRHADKF